MSSDNLDRDKMYAGDADSDYELAPLGEEPAPAAPNRPAAADEDDDADLELEPVDAEILAAAKRRAEETVVAASRAIDIDNIYRDAEPSGDAPLPTDLFKNIRYQFQVKHLLIATAVIAVLLAVVSRLSHEGVAGLLVVAFMLSVYAATAYYFFQERKRQTAADRRRQQMYDARREQAGYQAPRFGDEASQPASSAARKLTPEDFERAGLKSERERTPLVRQLSPGQWLAAGGCAALLIWIAYMLGGIQNSAVFFGVISMIGLSAYALGWDQPDALVFTWCVGLACSIAMGMLMAIWRSIAG